jgi:putative nucleotidyltransferase with HDIG domain
VSQALEALDVEQVSRVASAMPTYDVLEQVGRADRFERFRRHAVAVRLASERVADVARLPHRDELALAALLHDVGRLVLHELHGDRWGDSNPARAPDERARLERRELGVDHAVIGGVLLRRWGIPDTIATTVERHHASDATGHAAAIRLADLIVHHAGGAAIAGESLRAAAEPLEIDGGRLSGLLFEFPFAGRQRRRASDPCPLSMREVEALRGLAEGKVYKQIATELSLSVSTIRTHLHNVYRKLGAADRAQAVLIARDRGWI